MREFWERFQPYLLRTKAAGFLEYLQQLTPSQLDKFFLDCQLRELSERDYFVRVLIDARLAARRRDLGRPEPVEECCPYCNARPARPCKSNEAKQQWLPRHCKHSHFTCPCCDAPQPQFTTYYAYRDHMREEHSGRNMR